MSNLEVDAILTLAAFAGPGAASRLAEGRSILSATDTIPVVVGRALLEALGSFGDESLDHPFADTMSAIRTMPDGVHNKPPASEAPDESLARALHARALDIGTLIPRLQLAIRETQDWDERAGIVAVLDRALDAHRELSDWSSRAGAYRTDRAAEVLQEFEGLVAEIRAKAAAPFASAEHELEREVEVGEAIKDFYTVYPDDEGRYSEHSRRVPLSDKEQNRGIGWHDDESTFERLTAKVRPLTKRRRRS
ncbi:MAG TPA: hypothetical protein VMS88_09255 [Terriglobales bacterium]|nr:hypothetical protein [Terriglobales bacterium]